MSCELLRKCGLLLEAELLESGHSFVREEIRAKILPANIARGGNLKGHAHLRRKLLNVVEPVPHMSLRDATTSNFGKLPGQRPLPADYVNSSLNRFAMISHGAQHDRDICLNQQTPLLAGDKQVCHAYGAGMEKWNTLAERLSWAMSEARMDDKAVAAELSRRLGRKVPWQTIQSIRNGKAKATVYIARLAQVLGCNAMWLDSGEEEPYASGMPTGQAGDLTPAAIAFAKRWQALSPPLRSKVHDVLVAYESLAESETPAAPIGSGKGKQRRPVTS